ncbi:MAG: glycosyltransferase family 4 protein [Nanoarchaeota archaeon]|nr:glycosyltransferase family 4 protein [Nanoarchaeota archaeon]
MIRVLVLGSKEYPRDSLDKYDDPAPSGGMELYIDQLLGHLSKDDRFQFTVITRRGHKVPNQETWGGVRIFRVPFLRGYFRRNMTFNLMAFFTALRTPTDILFTHGEFGNFFGLLAAKLKRKPIVMVCHGRASLQPQYNGFVKKIFSLIDRFTYPRATAVATHTPQQLREITTSFTIIYPGLNETTKPAPSKQQDTKTILFVGRLINVKGVDVLLDALPKLKTKATCFIVGDGPKRQTYEEHARRLGLPVRFMGYRKDVPSFLSTAGVFVMSSYSESLNYAMLEAAAAGVPIVATDIGILPADAGFLVPPGNPEKLAEALDAMLADTKLRNSCIAGAKKFITKFSWKRASEQFADLFMKVT